MSNEILKRDQNSAVVLGGVTDDASNEIRMLRVNPSTNRLLISGIGGGASIGGTVSGGTDTSVLFIHPSGVLAQDASFTYDEGSNILTVPQTNTDTVLSSSDLVLVSNALDQYITIAAGDVLTINDGSGYGIDLNSPGGTITENSTYSIFNNSFTTFLGSKVGVGKQALHQFGVIDPADTQSYSSAALIGITSSSGNKCAVRLDMLGTAEFTFGLDTSGYFRMVNTNGAANVDDSVCGIIVTGVIDNPVFVGIGKVPAYTVDVEGDVALSGVLRVGSKATYYNGITTVSNGIPAEYATVDLTTQSAAITATTIYAVPASGVGQYRVSWIAKVTRAGSVSSVLGGTNGFQIKYTDANDAVVVTTGALANENTLALNTNTTQTIYAGSIMVNAKESTNIQYLIDYTSVGATTMQYNLHMKVEAL